MSIPSLHRRHFLTAGSLAVASAALAPALFGQTAAPKAIVTPPEGKRILLSCKLGMIANKVGDKALTIVERLQMARDAGFDGVDFDEAGGFTVEQARAAVQESGVFCHNAINHAHWSVRLTDPSAETRAQARANMDHCLRVAHAIGGSGILIVVGQASDGPTEEIEERCRQEIM